MDAQFHAVITGDIINSRNSDPQQWLSALQEPLGHYGNSRQSWDIYRGDTFQLVIDPEDALMAAFQLKASVRSNKNLDVRMGIGIGSADYIAESVLQSNGPAFVNSGEAYDNLGKQTLKIITPWEDFDTQFNLYLRLAAVISNQWAAKTAETVYHALMNPRLNQNELAEHMGKSQSTISESLGRAAYEEITILIQRYRQLILQKLCN